MRTKSNDGYLQLRGGGELRTLYQVLNDSGMLVLPAEVDFRESVLCKLHDSALVGHLGAEKML